MIVSQYGSVVLFNVKDQEVESYLKVVRIYSSGLLTDVKKDGKQQDLCEFNTRLLRIILMLWVDCAINYNVSLMVPVDFAVQENPLLDMDMQGGPDCVVLRTLDTDSVRVIGTVLGQSIALDYFVSQVTYFLNYLTITRLVYICRQCLGLLDSDWF